MISDVVEKIAVVIFMILLIVVSILGASQLLHTLFSLLIGE